MSKDEQKIYHLFEESLDIFISISNAKGTKPALVTQVSRFTEKPDQIILNRFKDLESLGINYK